MGLPDQRQPCRKVTADWMSHFWWHLESCLLCTGYDGALGKAQVLAEGYFGKNPADSHVEQGAQSKGGGVTAFSQEVKGKPLTRNYSTVYVNVKQQKLKCIVKNLLAHFKFKK